MPIFIVSTFYITRNYSFSEDEEETKRVVRTAKEKHYGELNNIIKLMRNHKKIKDMSKLLSSFEDLLKAYQKAKSAVSREDGGKPPKFYIKTLAELEDFCTENWEDRKNMNKNNSKSLTTMRQKLRKYNKDFETEIKEYRENPDAVEEEKDTDGEASDSDDEDDAAAGEGGRAKSVEDDATTARTKTTSITSKDEGSDEDDDDDSMWDMSSDDSSSSDDEDYGGNLAAKFLKKDTDKDKESKKREKKVKEVKERRKVKDDEGEWTRVEGGGTSVEKPKMFAKDAEINVQVMVKKLVEILGMRGKKRVDRLDQMDMLNELLTISRANNFGTALEVKIILGLQSALSDYSASSSCMKQEVWNKYLDNMDLLISLLNSEPELTVAENIAEEAESFQVAPFKVQGCLLTWVEKMDEEFMKMLQAADAHSPEYLDRLNGEKRVREIIAKVQKYLESGSHGTPADLCRVYILTIDYIYYKFDAKIVEKRDAERERVAKLGRRGNLLPPNKTGDPSETEVTDDSELTSMEIIDRLCKYIYTHDESDRIRKLAILCQVYTYALHDCWFEARDLMLMSGLPSTIIQHKQDIQLEVLYNRALVQLGLCAFRHGHIYEAHSSLLDILLKGRVRELLAQGGQFIISKTFYICFANIFTF